MSDTAPSPVKGQTNKNQVIMVAVLGVVLLLVLVFMVLKPFSGGDDSSSPEPAVTRTTEPPSTAAPSSGDSTVTPTPEGTPATPAAAPARGRNPFDPPR